MDRTVSAAQEADAHVEVRRLIAAGKCKQAVELAKAEHKRLNAPESEHVLVDAYLARIEQFQNKGATQDAQTLLNLVRQRFPGHQGRLTSLSLKSAAAEGNIEALVAPLGNAATSPEQQALIESALRRSLTDPHRLASCATLNSAHPLRLAAGAVAAAFDAVTTGPVTDEQIALPEVSRQSPLSDWKLLVRAIAAFYRSQDELVRRNAGGVARDSAVRRLADVLMAAVDQTPPVPGRLGALQGRIAASDKSLREALDDLEKAYSSYSVEYLQSSMRAALSACANSHPELLEKLRQAISIRCAVEGVPVDVVSRVTGAARRDASFWRLLAKSAEMQQSPQATAAFWDRFRVHAIREGMFSAGSPEDAVVRLHAAEVMTRSYALPSSDNRLFRVIREYYQNQPSEIAAFAPKTPAEVNAGTDPRALFRGAVEIDPHTSAFQTWYAWALGTRAPDRELEAMAGFWHQKLPTDPKPLLILSTLAEDRKALKLALTHLSAAEALDPMNPDARKARVRLTLATTWRHFTDRKPHLVKKDLDALAALPAMSEGDRPALLEAMRSAAHAIDNEPIAAQDAADRMAMLAGPLMGPELLESVKEMVRLPHADPPTLAPPLLPEPVAVADADARIIRLSTELYVPIYRPKDWSRLITQALRQSPCPLSNATLLAIAKGAIDREEVEQAYLASAAGLATATGTTAAWFLLRRAESLIPWANRRAAQCLRAALDLARQGHDPDLVRDVSEAVERVPAARAALDSASGRGLGDELLQNVLETERSAKKYPKDPVDAERHVVAAAVAVRYADEEFDDEDDDEDPDLDGPFDSAEFPTYPDQLTPGVIEEVLELLGRSGALPALGKNGRIDPKSAKRALEILAGLSDDPEEQEDEGGIMGRFRRLFRGKKNKGRR